MDLYIVIAFRQIRLTDKLHMLLFGFKISKQKNLQLVSLWINIILAQMLHAFSMQQHL